MLVAQSCLTLCNTMDCTPPRFSDRGILQARRLEWVTMPFSDWVCSVFQIHTHLCLLLKNNTIDWVVKTKETKKFFFFLTVQKNSELKIKVLAIHFLMEAFYLACKQLPYFCIFSYWREREQALRCVLRPPILLHQGPTLRAHLMLITSIKNLFPIWILRV